MVSGVTLLVVVCMPLRLKLGCIMAFNAVTTTGKKAGRQPAITALAAIFSTVALPFSGGMIPRRSSRLKPLVSIISSTASGVGGITGNPSVQPRSARVLNARAGEAGMKLDALTFDSVALKRVESDASTSPPVRASTIRAMVDSASDFNLASDIDPTGCGTLTSGRLGRPRVSASALARTTNSSVTMVAVGMAAASSWTESWTLHDVHAPQSAKAVIT
jgi:hypothetical protein